MNDQERGAQYWNDKGYFPTADIRLFRTFTGWIRALNSYTLKQRWTSSFGYEDIWLAFPIEKEVEE